MSRVQIPSLTPGKYEGQAAQVPARTFAVFVYGRSVPATEAAFGVDDLAGDPGGIVGDQPGDQAGRVVRDAPATAREVAADDFVHVRRGVAGIDRAGVDRVQRDAAAGQLVG